MITVAAVSGLSVLARWNVPDADELAFLVVVFALGAFLRSVIPAVLVWFVALPLVTRYMRERLAFIGAVTIIAVIGWANLTALVFSVFGPRLTGSNAVISGISMALPVAIAVGIAVLMYLYPTKRQNMADRYSECGAE